MKNQQKGFTLVEIAIVLVIIGLLLGGVLKGQELINSAKVKNFATDFRNIPLFIYGYQDKYKSLPGDDSAASTHVTGRPNGYDCGGLHSQKCGRRDYWHHQRSKHTDHRIARIVYRLLARHSRKICQAARHHHG